MKIPQVQEIAAHVNKMDEPHLNVRLRELNEYSELGGLNLEEQIELTYICLKILAGLR